MRILRLILPICCLAALSCGRRTLPEDSPSDPVWHYAGFFAPYAHGDLSDTPAPEGYKPFYLSHYGRHGSRYNASWAAQQPIIDALEDAASEGRLTPRGRRIADSLHVLMADLREHMAQITPRGEQEHRNIAARMVLRFPGVFGKGGRVSAVASSEGGRCVVSMCFSTNELQKLVPSLEMTFRGGEFYYDLLCPRNFPKDVIYPWIQAEKAAQIADSLDCGAVLGRMFTDVTPELASDAPRLCAALYDLWRLGGCMDRNFIDIFSVMDERDLLALKKAEDNRYFAGHCNGEEYGKQRLAVLRPLLDDIISRADAAVAGSPDGSPVVADLRYGHDSGITPLASVMRLEPFSTPYSFREAAEHWDASRWVPMAANLQLVFYRRGPGDPVLVKALLNEQETAFPFVTPVCGPYYEWNALKASWLEYADR